MDIFIVIIVGVILIYINQFVQKSKKKENYSANKVISANKITNGLKVEKLSIRNVEKDQKNKDMEIFITDEQYIFCIWKYQGLFLKEVGKINKDDIQSISAMSLREKTRQIYSSASTESMKKRGKEMEEFYRQNPQIGRERDTIYFDDSNGNQMVEIETKTEKIADKLLNKIKYIAE